MSYEEEVIEEVIVVEEAPVEVELRAPRAPKETKYREKVKTFRVKIKPGSSLYTIDFEQGGEIPKVLKGMYTSIAAAKSDIKLYEVNRKQYCK